ncbi:hypothetical protein TREMEDRAFT_64918 [Tremella mesenterica DSM 1558]|uniref:uncharacterized protein n=1 Tax=Tremella mesenterica (strain ATCC 24925 / CBS 8224 / DSM 1558 / NBRC 9311 / NRRL Y-6157 / RJB 2259-6 / UBC 559-6) TaxID=578456 RepID=UPI0003F4922E|nr:uncharacterized protein TREMEDRAFT_64918 [Tremella mesenterica DSM 1558]EIW67050.1 hypothetical protein TREMEDRAFT_64918 [Tremella mesenterica DSM 1558]
MSAARRATMVIAANRFSVFKLSMVRTSTSFLRSAIISSCEGGGTSSDDEDDDDDGAGDGRGGEGGGGTMKAPGTTGDGERRSTTGGTQGGRGPRGGGDGDNSHKGAPGRAARKETEGGRGGGRPGSSSDGEGDAVTNTDRPAGGGDGHRMYTMHIVYRGWSHRDGHRGSRGDEIRSHSSPLGASSHLPGWAARRAKRLAEVLTVPERGTGEEEGASTRTRLRAGVGEDKADEEDEDTDIGEECCRCLFLGDRRMEGFLDELASFEGVFLLAGVEDGPATGAGGAEEEEGADSEGRAADKEERRRPAELARRRTKDEGGAGGGD